MSLAGFAIGANQGLQQALQRRLAQQQQQFENERMLKADARAQQQLDALLEQNAYNRRRQEGLDLVNAIKLDAELKNQRGDDLRAARETFTPGQMVPNQLASEFEAANVPTGMGVPGVAPRLYTSPTDKTGTPGADPGRAGVLLTPTQKQAERAADDTRADRQAGETAAYRTEMASIARQNANARQQGSGGASPAVESNIINRLTKQWDDANKPAQELDRQIAMMDAGLAAARRGDVAQGSQAVLVTFQKVLDPTSVVRESEYMRSAAGQSLLNRVKGAYERLAQGGAGVPLPELEKFAQLAREAAQAQRGGFLDGRRKRIAATAERYRIPLDVIFDDELNGGGASAPAAPKRKRYDLNGNPIPE